ncbi:carboxypeptidase M-like [Onthophagus taurus]|uniref:carboxypeptidase M-like n=1 Tax=Onthophagus taurus TaxID=166361 RepID=UPI000C208E48|nr:carboxypeptidase M-like [Onthophagus taurus]
MRLFNIFCVSFIIVLRLKSVQLLDFEFHNNKALTNVLKNFSSMTRNGIDVKMYSIGKSTGIHDVKSEDMWVLEITAAQNLTGIPNVKLISGVFGDEHIGTEILLHFVDYLISSYETEKSVKYLLDNTRIHILSRMNPSGYPITHGNPFRYDLDTMFPDLYKGPHGTPQLESEAVMKWMNDNYFVLSATLNYVYNNFDTMEIIYPYNTKDLHQTSKESITSDNDVFKHLANVYSTNYHSNIEQEINIRNGAKTRPTLRTMQDYNYFKHGCMELNIKIEDSSKYKKNTMKIQQSFENNKKALVEYYLQANQGVFGVIRDSETNEPIIARFKVIGREMLFKTNAAGEFWKILVPGNYKIEVSADGYYRQNVSFQVNLTTPYPQLTRLQILLVSKNTVTTTESTLTQPQSEMNTIHLKHIPEVIGPKIGARVSNANRYNINLILIFLSILAYVLCY